MRYRMILSYMGTNYSGWQKQPGARTVQKALEDALSTILREAIEVVGCGRTDTGVHARNYSAHFNTTVDVDLLKTVYKVNAILPTDIAVWAFLPEKDDFHARFDAIERSYSYSIHFLKDPFVHYQSFYLNTYQDLDQDKMHQAARIIMQHEHFSPFCKTGSDNKNFQCIISHSEWHFEKQGCSYNISANRFLRGMVRLIVGACLNVGYNRVSLEELDDSLINQKPLLLQWSVPPQGLCFQSAIYPPSNYRGAWVAYPNDTPSSD